MVAGGEGWFADGREIGDGGWGKLGIDSEDGFEGGVGAAGDGAAGF